MSGRGRGRKALSKSNTDHADAVPEKRAGRKKQFAVVATITPDGIEGCLQPEIRRPLIAHLPIQSRDVVFHDEPLKYDPTPPENVEPFGSFIDNPFSEERERIPDTVSTSMTNDAKHKDIDAIEGPSGAAATPEKVNYYQKDVPLVQYKNMSEIKKIPESSDTACMWCCHTFEGRPCVLPMRDEGEYLNVCGNFCCPECAMTHLFDTHQDSHTRWEQLALLNRVYASVCGGRIYPAPPRSTLKLFGGPYTIEEYRGVIRQGKLRADVHLPPMVSILATMDTKPIDFYDVSLTRNVMETVKERLQKAEEVLKLRRTKPLKAWESTLDACMNLRINAS